VLYVLVPMCFLGGKGQFLGGICENCHSIFRALTILIGYLTLCRCSSTEAASCAIVKFLEIESSEETSNGWMLLSAINLLSLGPMSLIDCMTAASLPSTLVKCLYLFFDLPPLRYEDRLEEGCQFTPRERRVLLQKVVAQVCWDFGVYRDTILGAWPSGKGIGPESERAGVRFHDWS
jgi:hypothetical protein